MNDFAADGCQVYTRSMVTLSAVESGGASIMFSPRCQPAWAAAPFSCGPLSWGFLVKRERHAGK